jgi:Domain of unknown function (DUF4439)
VSAADERLTAALEAEHAAIFGYGAVGAHAAGNVGLAQAAELAHRNRRDALIVRLTSKGVAVPAAQPVYTLPFPVTDLASALKLATTIEDRCAAIWRLALPDTTGDERKLALDALIDCATRGTGFRKAAGTTPLTTPFPGRVSSG